MKKKTKIAVEAESFGDQAGKELLAFADKFGKQLNEANIIIRQLEVIDTDAAARAFELLKHSLYRINMTVGINLPEITELGKKVFKDHLNHVEVKDVAVKPKIKKIRVKKV